MMSGVRHRARFFDDLIQVRERGAFLRTENGVYLFENAVRPYGTLRRTRYILRGKRVGNNRETTTNCRRFGRRVEIENATR